MKKFAVMFAAAILVFGGCTFLMGPDAPVTDGNLMISLGDSPALFITSGTGLPADVKAAMRYELTLTGPDGEISSRSVSGGKKLSITAALGDWRIDARAYQHDSPTLAGTGSAAFTVIPGINAIRVPINMNGVCYEISHAMNTGHPNFTAAFPGTTITVVPNDGYVFKTDSGTYNSTPFSGSGFTMPSADITVNGDFVSASPIRYVTATGAGSVDGLSWSSASNDLQLMMDQLEFVTEAGYGPCIVKMGAGTYKPRYKMDGSGVTVITTPANDQNSAFMLRPGVQVWGGYPPAGGTEAERGQAANITFLDGDINNDNTLNGNAYHVVLGIDIDGGTILDGLTISGGDASGTSSPAIAGKTVNQRYGGGMYLDGSSPVLINVTISGNEANHTGGGMYNLGSSPVLINSTLSGNQAYYGGGIYNDGSSPVLVNVLISGNLASQTGGGMENAGTNSSPVLTNVTISGNKALTNGGGMYNNSAAGQARIRNSVIWGNRASTTWSTNGIGVTGSAPTVSSSIVENSYGSGTGWTHPSSANNGGGNAADPGSSAPDSPFTGWQDPSGTMPNSVGDYSLNTNPANPAANAGSSGLYPAGANDAIFPAGLSTAAKAAINAVLGKDRAGGARKNGVIDMGAYER